MREKVRRHGKPTSGFQTYAHVAIHGRKRDLASAMSGSQLKPFLDLPNHPLASFRPRFELGEAPRLQRCK